MDRRDVLKLGALASVSGSGCAALLGNPGAVSSGELGGFLSALDDAMASVTNGDFFARLMTPTEDPEITARAKAGEELTKKTMRSLLLVGTLSELPPEQLAHESVQARLRDSMGEFDDAMFGMSNLLENLSPAERVDISKALKDDPNLGMRVMGAVDQEAASFGVSLKQRTKLRAISAQVTSRLKSSADLTATEYVGKMQKIAARHGGYAEAQRQMATSVATQMIWQGEAAGGTVGGQPELTPPPPPPPVTPDQPNPQQTGVVPLEPQPLQKPKRKGNAHVAVLTAGGIALGLGAVIFGVGFAVGSGWQLVGATFGVLLGVAGLVCLIVGLILLAAGK